MAHIYNLNHYVIDIPDDYYPPVDAYEMALKPILPENIPLLVAGGQLGIFEIILLHVDNNAESYRSWPPQFHQGLVRKVRSRR